MKNECNVARDLMPLVIDGVASEESQKYVDEHIAECHECKLMCGEMHAALPQVTAERENAALEKAAKAMYAKRTVRALWAVIMSMAALLIALLANANTVAGFLDDMWYELRYVGPNNELRFEAYNVELEWQSHTYVSLTVETSPSGNRPFIPDLQLRYDEMTGEAYLQFRAYASEELYLTDMGSMLWGNVYEYLYSDICGYEATTLEYGTKGMIYAYPETEKAKLWTSTDITHIELVCGNERLVLWKNGDGLPASCKAGRVSPGIEPIPTPTPTPTPFYWNSNSTSYVVMPTPVSTSTPTPKPALPSNKR